MKKQWQLKEIDIKDIPVLPASTRVSDALDESTRGGPEYPPLIVRLLALRGITDPEKIRDFLDPDYGKLPDPFLFKDMQKTVERINLAIEQKQKITIYADYDADAITACAVLYLALKKLGGNVATYIPDRFAEGYGMNLEAIKKFGEDGTNLVITVDCGINAVEEAALCKVLGLDLIITDHHEITGALPDALAIINPKNPHDEYPFPYLTGVGVAFKLIQALFAKNPGWEKWFLDLVALGTVADIQSLTGENRILVSFGLKVLQKTRWHGLKAMLASSGLSGKAGSGSAGKSPKYDAFTLGFILAPRINAAGRIKHADIAFKLLISENPEEAVLLATELSELNKQRQVLTDQILSEARGQLALAPDKKVLIAHGTDWPKGVIGLVAGKLCEEYNRPVLAISVTIEGLATGSARSTPNFDLVAALNFSKDLLQKYGGHTQAAGFTLAQANLPNFHQKLLDYAEIVNLTISDPVINIEALLKPEEVTWENLNYLESMGPFGLGNPKPKLLAEGLEVVEVRLVGSDGKHIKMRLKYGEHTLEAISFGQGFLASALTPGKKIDAVCFLETNEWNGNRRMQLKIQDIKIKDQAV